MGNHAKAKPGSPWPHGTRHGTYAGHQAHLARGEQGCQECRLAAADYMAKYRKAHPEVLVNQRRVTKVRNRALARLSREFPARYAELLEEERRIERAEWDRAQSL